MGEAVALFSDVTKRQEAFLTAYPSLGTIKHAAEMAGISRQTHYRWLTESPEYASAFDAAKQDARDVLVRQVISRATQADKPSDVLLIFMLKALDPATFCDRYRAETRRAGTEQDPRVVAREIVEFVREARATVGLG